MSIIPKPKQLRPSLHGRMLGLGDNQEIIVNDQVVVPGPAYRGQRCILFDDFNGDALDAQWGVQSGSDGSALDPAVNSQAGGVCRLVGGSSNTSLAADGSQLERYLCWEADKGDLELECMLKLDAITTVQVFIGFTDQVGSLEMPIYSAASADTITTDASDAVGFFFDTQMTTDDWWLAGVAADTDATQADSGKAPTAATYQRFKIMLDESGNAKFWIDGDEVGTVDSAVTASTLLTPVVCVRRLAASLINADLDYIYVAQDR